MVSPQDLQFKDSCQDPFSPWGTVAGSGERGVNIDFEGSTVQQVTLSLQVSEPAPGQETVESDWTDSGLGCHWFQGSVYNHERLARPAAGLF